MTLILTIGLWFPIAFAALKWDRLADGVRRTVRAFFLAAAAICLAGAALASGGYSQDVVLYIGGPNPYLVETVERSYAGLLLGAAVLLAALYGLSRWGNRLPGQGVLAQAFKLSFTVIAVRVFLEKLGVPVDAAMLVGVIWLAAPLGVYFGMESASNRLRRFWFWLFGYAFGLRLAIAAIMTAATLWQLGTHFDNSNVVAFTVLGRDYQVEPQSWDQISKLILTPQLLLWPTVTIVIGVLFGLPARMIAARRRRQVA